MTDETTTRPGTDAPATYRTPQRPGQTGAQDQQRAGPNPHSSHPTGPHAPYDKDDLDGFAAIKNAGLVEAEPVEARARKGLDGENFTVLDRGKPVR